MPPPPAFREMELVEEFKLTGTMTLQEKYKAAKKRLYMFAQEVSIIGVRATMDGSRSVIRRLVWVVLVVFGICLAVYQIQDRIGYYVSFPTSTNLNINEQNQLVFPQVTFCNENLFRKSVATEYGE